MGDVTSSNTLSLEGGTVYYLDTISIKIKIDNLEEFVAFQMHIPIPEHLTLLGNSVQLNANRITNHQIVSSFYDDTLRILSYSPSNDHFLGDSGTVATFDFIAGAQPLTAGLFPVFAQVIDSLENNIIDLIAGTNVQVLSPDIYPQVCHIDFGNVPVEDSIDRQLRIYNQGTLPLHIQDVNINDSLFRILNDTNFIISTGNYQDILIRFNALAKGNFTPSLNILSDDPDEDSIHISLHAHAYTINELHTGNILAHYGDTVQLVFSMNNQEEISSLQFDLTMHSCMEYVPESANLSDRKTDHVITAALLPSGKLRVLAYSLTNDVFLDHDGDILELWFVVQGIQGDYWLNVSNGIIGNQLGENVLSAAYGGLLHMLAPNISCPTVIDFGEVNILDTANILLTIDNLGSDSLVISQFKFDNENLYDHDFGIPLVIQPASQAIGSISFHDSTWGSKSHILKIYSNDPDEPIKTVNLLSNVYRPNFAFLTNDTCYFQDTAFIDFIVENYSEFIGFQFDITHPIFMLPLMDSIRLTDRATDHVLQKSVLDSNTIRIFSYSTSLSSFQGESGALLNLQFLLDYPQTGNYAMTLSDVTLVDNNLDNVLYSYQDGSVELVGPLSTEWVGAVSSDWGNTSNWSNGLPFKESTVSINASAPFQPAINQNVEIKRLILNTSTQITINGTYVLTLNGKE